MGQKNARRTKSRETSIHVAEKPSAEALIHERTRLGIVCALATSPSVTFQDLKRILNTTDGNLSVHARKLEDAGVITVEKWFQGRVPRTSFSLTETGRSALRRYLDHMEALIHATRR